MANVTIPNLTSATTIAPSTDLMVLEQTNGTRKATLSQIFTSSATSGSGLGITSGGVYTIKSGLDSDISDINTLLGSTSIASIGDGTVTGAVSQINSDLSVSVGTLNTSGASAQGNNYTQSVTIPKGGLYLCTINHKVQQNANGVFSFSVPSVANRVYGNTGCTIVASNFPIVIGNSFNCIVDTRGLNTDYDLQFIGWSQQAWSTWTTVDYVKIPTS